ncbi:unnamed protein product [Amoebophrya sp. A120]|nr:unnamed protein product [Amoebophrya sp. A120]|eukprot:GSA120T00003385001.1
MTSSPSAPGDVPGAGVLPFGDDANSPELTAVLGAIAKSVVDIGVRLREGGAEFAAEAVGTQNSFGDVQLSVDVSSDKVVFQRLKGLAAVASSEETTEEVSMEGPPHYSVAFDPLDGSSIVDANFTVGSIFGVWPGSTLLNVTGKQQHAAAMAMYGPRITMAVATVNHGTVEFTWAQNSWRKTKSFAVQPKLGKVFAPGNLRATADNALYSNLVQHWIKEKYTLRYTGGMVPDVYHILFKGKGIFTNCSSPGAKAKLRLLYECAPIAFLVERAGGASLVDPAFSAVPQSVLEIAAQELDQRIGVVYGGKEEVDLCQKHLFPEN